MRLSTPPRLRASAMVVGRHTFACAVALLLALAIGTAQAALPREIGRAFLDQKIPLNHVSVFVQDTRALRPWFTHQPKAPMNPASTMKLVTTFVALQLLGADYTWKTHVYADGPVTHGVLHGNLVIKGSGDPKITIEQFQNLMRALRATGLSDIRGDLVLDRTLFVTADQDPGRFDNEPLRPYNVAPDALLVNFKSVRFAFTPNATTGTVEVRPEPALPGIIVKGAPQLTAGPCGDWRSGIAAAFAPGNETAGAVFGGTFAEACGEQSWYVSLLDHSHYVHAMFDKYWREAGGVFKGNVRDGSTPKSARLVATLESPPLYDVIRDINKLSNNVMARQLFLTLGSVVKTPATKEAAAEFVKRWLARRNFKFTELVLENGSGLSRRERISTEHLGALLLAADKSTVAADYMSSLAVAATDGTVRARFLTNGVAGQAFLKTGTLEGVRALAGYVLTADGRRLVVVCIVNHPNAARAQEPMDALVQWLHASSAERVR